MGFFITKQAKATIQVDVHTQYLGADLLHLLSQLLPGIAMADPGSTFAASVQGKEGMAELMDQRGKTTSLSFVGIVGESVFDRSRDDGGM